MRSAARRSAPSLGMFSMFFPPAPPLRVTLRMVSSAAAALCCSLTVSQKRSSMSVKRLAESPATRMLWHRLASPATSTPSHKSFRWRCHWRCRAGAFVRTCRPVSVARRPASRRGPHARPAETACLASTVLAQHGAHHPPDRPPRRRQAESTQPRVDAASSRARSLFSCRLSDHICPRATHRLFCNCGTLMLLIRCW
jgi:hypothetical protein